MPLAPFDGPRLKLRRARYHIGDLTEQIRAYLKRGPFYLEVAEAPPGWASNKRWFVRVKEDVPADFSAIIGDVIHNLRAALDVMACELVRANNQSDDGVYFPFADSESELEGQIKRKHFDRAKPEAITLLRSMKPYRGGNIALRALHDLDVIDKHQALIPTSDMIGSPTMPGSSQFHFGPIRDGMSVTIQPGQEHLPIGFIAHGEFVLRFEMLRVTIDGIERSPLGSSEVVPTLESLANLVEGYVEAFAAL